MQPLKFQCGLIANLFAYLSVIIHVLRLLTKPIKHIHNILCVCVRVCVRACVRVCVCDISKCTFGSPRLHVR